MKSILITLASVFALSGFAVAGEAKEVTVSGKVICAHCDLSVGDSCNEAIQSKDVVYLLTGDKAAKFFGENKKVKAVTATGKATDKGDYQDLKVSKIEKAKG